MAVDNMYGDEYEDKEKKKEQSLEKEESKKKAGCCDKLCCLCLKLPCCPCSHKAKKFAKDTVHIDSSYKPDRWPTDSLCVILFAVFWVGMVIIAIFAIWSGNPLTLIKPTDYNDNMCGYATGEGNNNLVDLSEKKYLWYPFSFSADITETQFIDALDLGICVSACPTAAIISTSTLTFDNLTAAIASWDVSELINTEMIVCNYGYETLSDIEKVYKVLNKTDCWLNIFPTTSVTNRCIPNLANATNWLGSALSNQYKNLINTYMMLGDVLKTGLAELQTSWFALVTNMAVTLIMCFILVLLIRIFLRILIYISLVAVLISLIILTAYSGWVAYDEYQDSKVYNEDGSRALDSDGQPAVDESNRRFSYVVMGIFGVFLLCTLGYVVILIVMFFRIGKAVGIIEVASRVVFYNAQLLIVPPLTFLVMIGITAYWMMIAGYIASATQPAEFDASTLSSLPISLPFNSTSYTVRKDSVGIQVMQIYHLFGYFWTSTFLNALGYCTIAGVIAQWYFSATGDPNQGYRETSEYKKRTERLSVIRSLLRSLIFHCGSILFGSLIVAIVQILRVLLREVEKKLTLLQGKKNPVVKWVIKVAHVLLAILKWLIKFFNKNAYIVMMIHGSSFLTSGARAFQLIITNILIVGSVTVVGNLTLFFIQVMITILGGCCTYFVIWLFDKKLAIRFLFAERIRYSLIPTLTGAFMSFIVAGMFINLYATSIDTVLICYCEDRRRDPKNYPYTPLALRNASSKLLAALSLLKKKKSPETTEEGKEVELKEKK